VKQKNKERGNVVITNKIIANIINEPIIDEHIDSSLVSKNLLLF
jgi:hypothetical protein